MVVQQLATDTFDITGDKIRNKIRRFDTGFLKKKLSKILHGYDLLQLCLVSFLFKKWNVANVRTFKRITMTDS